MDDFAENHASYSLKDAKWKCHCISKPKTMVGMAEHLTYLGWSKGP